MHVLASVPTFLLGLLWCRIQMLPPDSEVDIIYKLIQMSDIKKKKSYTYRQQQRCMNEAAVGTMPGLL